MMRTGTVSLPLHGGKTPRWLFSRMVKLARAIVDSLVYEYGSSEFLRRISDPYWFQAFSCALGFDWHSSGTTTTTCGALKVAINPEEHGLAVAGGKGRTSRNTPSELDALGSNFSMSGDDVERLKYASRLSAKVDNSLIQDGYQLYHHSFIFNEDGGWAVVQQGMNESYARRYHWLGEAVDDFVEEPHSAICCDRVNARVLDLTAKQSRETKKISLDLVLDGPVHLAEYLGTTQRTLVDFTMPRHHPVLDADLNPRSIEVLRKAYEIQPESYEALISLRGMGSKTIRALALISDLVYGNEASWQDPVKYSFTVGGKDGYPYPVDREVYDKSIVTLREALDEAKLDKRERYLAIKRLSNILADSTF